MHVTRPAAELLYTREQEQYLGMCRRWRDISKPTVAMVQGACIAGGLMLAWVCDLIVASEDAFFQDPVNRCMGIPGVEYFAHAFELPPRIAKEFLLLGERMSAARQSSSAWSTRSSRARNCAPRWPKWAAKLAAQPRLGNWLTKQAVNHVEELRGKRSAMDAVFHMHHFAHAQNDLVSAIRWAGSTANPEWQPPTRHRPGKGWRSKPPHRGARLPVPVIQTAMGWVATLRWSRPAAMPGPSASRSRGDEPR